MVPSIGLAHSSSLCKNKPYCVALEWNLSPANSSLWPNHDAQLQWGAIKSG